MTLADRCTLCIRRSLGVVAGCRRWVSWLGVAAGLTRGQGGGSWVTFGPLHALHQTEPGCRGWVSSLGVVAGCCSGAYEGAGRGELGDLRTVARSASDGAWVSSLRVVAGCCSGAYEGAGRGELGDLRTVDALIGYQVASVVYWSPLLPPCPPVESRGPSRQARPMTAIVAGWPSAASVRRATDVLPGVTPWTLSRPTRGVSTRALTSARCRESAGQARVSRMNNK